MFDKRIPRNQKKKRSKTKDAVSSGPKPARHPLFGEIPFIHHQAVDANGKIHEWWQQDPNYQPKMPFGAVRGDVSKQVYCTAHHTPKYFYVDEEHTCIQCGRAFVFGAREQKFWYETLKFNFSSIPIRCLACRRERRSEHALREQIARAKADVLTGNPAGYLALARAIVEYHERTQHGNLNEAIAAARKARELWRESLESYLWEGIAHARAGHYEKAKTNLSDFLSQSNSAPLVLRKKAETYLRQLSSDDDSRSR